MSCSALAQNVRGVLVNKCAGQHSLKTVHFREILASGNLQLFLRVPWVNKQLASSDFTFRKRQKVAGVKYDEKWSWENILAPFFTASY
jgi:hypothetical protein